MLIRILSLFLLSVVCLPGSASAVDERIKITGPVSAEIIRVIDGDTVLVAAKPWPQQTVEVYVRLRGIDAPELRSACSAIRAAGRAAKIALSELVRNEPEIYLSQISGDKYFGRVLADMVLPDGRNPAQEMLGAGYVTPYEGGPRGRDCASAKR